MIFKVVFKNYCDKIWLVVYKIVLKLRNNYVLYNKKSYC